MFSKLVIIVLSLCLAAAATPAEGARCGSLSGVCATSRVVVSKPVVSTSKRVITSSAVTHGVPVSTIVPFVYAYTGQSSYMPDRAEPAFSALSDSALDRLAEKLAARLGVVGALSAYPTSQRHCAGCHGSEAKAEERGGGFVIPEIIDAETSVRMIDRITHVDPEKRMPKGKQLPDAEVMKLIRELAQPSP